jgi:hypothetical protein
MRTATVVLLSCSICLIGCGQPEPSEQRLAAASASAAPPLEPVQANGSPQLIDGLTDAEREFNEHWSTNVTAGNNIALVTLTLVGANSLRDRRLDDTCAMLCIDPTIPEVLDTRSREGLNHSGLVESLRRPIKRPWSTLDYASNELLEMNSPALDLIVASYLTRDRYYFPFLRNASPDPQKENFLEVKLDFEASQEFVIRMLCARAIYRLEGGETQKAIEDLHAAMWLGILTQRSGIPLICERVAEILLDVGTALRRIVRDAASPETRRQVLRILTNLPDVTTADELLWYGDRLCVHDVLANQQGSLELLDAVLFLVNAETDLDAVKAAIDAEYQPVYDALQIQNLSMRTDRFAEITDRMRAWMDDAKALKNRVDVSDLGEGKTPIEDWLGKFLACLIMGQFEQLDFSVRYISAQVELTKTLAAIELYKDENGEWPSDLGILVPDYLTEIVNDPFTDAPLEYVLEERGYTLRSVGARIAADRTTVTSVTVEEVRDGLICDAP